MKKSILALCMLGLFAACEDETVTDISEETTTPTSIINPLLGSWTWTGLEDNEGSYTPSGCELLESISFGANEVTFTEYYTDDACELVEKVTELYSFDGNTISYIGIDDEGSYTYSETFEIIGDKLYLSYEDEIVEYTYTSENLTDDTPISTDLDLIGTWTWTAFTDNDGVYELGSCDLMDTLSFDTSEVYITQYDTDNSDGCESIYEATETYSVNGNTITYSGSDQDGAYTYEETYAINNGKLYLTTLEVSDGEIYMSVSEYTRE